MGLFGRKSKRNDDLSVGGLPGTAVVQRRRSQFGSDEGEQREELKIDLEVRLDDGRAPYAVSGTFPVPRDFLTIAEGNELPVKVDPDDPKRIFFDWDAFVDGGAAVRSSRSRATSTSATRCVRSCRGRSPRTLRRSRPSARSSPPGSRR